MPETRGRLASKQRDSSKLCHTTDCKNRIQCEISELWIHSAYFGNRKNEDSFPSVANRETTNFSAMIAHSKQWEKQYPFEKMLNILPILANLSEAWRKPCVRWHPHLKQQPSRHQLKRRVFPLLTLFKKVLLEVQQSPS